MVVYSRWSFNEGGRLGRFDCICNLNKVALIGAPVCVTRFHWSKIFEFNYVSWDFISRIYVTVNVIGYLPFFFQIMELI